MLPKEMSVIVGEVKISEKFEKNHSQFSGKVCISVVT